MFDFLKIGEKVQALKARLEEVQVELKRMRVEGEVGGGAVKAVVSGDRQLIALEFDEALLATEDDKTRYDLVIAAVNTAMRQAELRAKEAMKARTSDIVPSVAGMDLSNLL